MKKREKKRRNGNVILFPDLEFRLLEKGLEHLKDKKFRQAIEFFEEAKQLAPENNDIYIGLVLAYYEAGYLQEAKQLSKEMLKEGIGDYLQTVDIYLMILVQLHEYEEIVTTIEVLLDEVEIPEEKREQFSKMLEFSRRMVEDTVDTDSKPEISDSEESTLHQIFHSDDPKELLLKIAQLSHINIRPFLDDIKLYLNSEATHPFLKTMLLNVLKEQEYNEDITIEKFGRKKTVNPVSLYDIHDIPLKEEIIVELREHIESDDPVLFEHVLSLLERHLFLLFPFELIPNNEKVWAAAFHSLVLQYHWVDTNVEEISSLYQVDLQEVLNSISNIRKIEEISYPII